MLDRLFGYTAYKAYGEHRKWLTYDGKPMPQWEDLKPEIQSAWCAAAGAAAKLARDMTKGGFGISDPT